MWGSPQLIDNVVFKYIYIYGYVNRSFKIHIYIYIYVCVVVSWDVLSVVVPTAD